MPVTALTPQPEKLMVEGKRSRKPVLRDTEKEEGAKQAEAPGKKASTKKASKAAPATAARKKSKKDDDETEVLGLPSPFHHFKRWNVVAHSKRRL